jgi:hypothetical protein
VFVVFPGYIDRFSIVRALGIEVFNGLVFEISFFDLVKRYGIARMIGAVVDCGGVGFPVIVE